MVARVWTSAQIKETAKGLQAAGYTVVKRTDSYVATIGDGNETVVLKALRMQGTGYLVRYDERLFQYAEVGS